MAFNQSVNLYQNVKASLIANGKSIEDAATDIGTTPASIKNRIGAKFLRNGKSTPLDQRIFEYLKNNCTGFTTYCRENDIRIVS
ncbi:hypothetical protein E0765_06180 [Sulfuricurvum sp. IAE1]|uniref:hypothetical protein n=1 Tax=Sulfuricurvum sp. IAE1 TaxID=2546102 RepID=UPI0010502679|nr:hypothetical protein [Sulfuricurvum sp. IAE1]TDA64300.1 hypothetical protein E0765_06180 [Sulfuricurvum sp. IAE1]